MRTRPIRGRVEPPPPTPEFSVLREANIGGAPCLSAAHSQARTLKALRSPAGRSLFDVLEPSVAYQAVLRRLHLGTCCHRITGGWPRYPNLTIWRESWPGMREGR